MMPTRLCVLQHSSSYLLQMASFAFLNKSIQVASELSGLAGSVGGPAAALGVVATALLVSVIISQVAPENTYNDGWVNYDSITGINPRLSYARNLQYTSTGTDTLGYSDLYSETVMNSPTIFQDVKQELLPRSRADTNSRRRSNRRRLAELEAADASGSIRRRLLVRASTQAVAARCDAGWCSRHIF